MSATQFLAWWGGIVATLVLFWDIYKEIYRSGPRIRFNLYSDMKILGDERLKDKIFIRLEAKNYGNLSTTIENISFHFFPTVKSFFFYSGNKLKIPQQSFVVARFEHSKTIPYILSPGTVWEGMLEQINEINNQSKSGIVIFHLHHSHSAKPIRKKIFMRVQNNLKKKNAG